MSWFNTGMESLKGLTEKVSERVENISERVNVNSIKEMTGKVSDAMPKFEKDVLQKLTLTSPELLAERHRIDEEEKRKERVRDMLAGMLPWETRDEERDILVEECKEAILKLSGERETFFGPYEMPNIGVKLDKKKNKGDDDDEGGDGEEEEVDAKNDHHHRDEGEEEDEEETAARGSNMKPSAESLEKLAKLEPLPPLLQDFDLDAHVGLIQNLLKADKKLVKMQSELSGGGEREHTFWHNYFFHCAYTRYEAGLTIDEIWSDQPEAHQQQQSEAAAAAAAAAKSNNNKTEETTKRSEEMTITFQDKDEQEESSSPSPTALLSGAQGGKAFPAEPTTDPDAPFGGSGGGGNHNKKETGEKEPANSPSSNSVTADFEMVGSPDADVSPADEDPAVDYELDELEAEIARELED